MSNKIRCRVLVGLPPYLKAGIAASAGVVGLDAATATNLEVVGFEGTNHTFSVDQRRGITRLHPLVFAPARHVVVVLHRQVVAALLKLEASLFSSFLL
jgi:hypothetical protein